MIFPIKQTGILGISFLEKQEVTLTFRDKLPNSLQFGKGKSSSCIFTSFDLVPRTKTLISIPVKNSNTSGYMRKIDVGPGIYVGEVLASQENGFARIYAINTTTEKITLTIPSVELEEFDIKPPAPRSYRPGDSNLNHSGAHAQRFVQLVKALNLESLNEAERVSILEIVNEFPYQFYLPTDKLGYSNIAQHTIVTTDESTDKYQTI